MTVMNVLRPLVWPEAMKFPKGQNRCTSALGGTVTVCRRAGSDGLSKVVLAQLPVLATASGSGK